MAEKKTNVLIVGAGKGGAALIDLLHKSPNMHVVGIVDIDSDAPGIKLAQYLCIPTGADYKEFFKEKDLDEIINVTGSEKIHRQILQEKPDNVELIGGHSAKLMWGLVEEQKKAKEDLKEFEDNYRTIFNSATDAIFIQDVATGRIVDVNNKACELLGYSEDEIKQIDIGTISLNEPPYSQQDAMNWMQKTISEGAQIFEWRAKRKDGSLFWAEVNLKNITVAGEDRIISVFRDIDKRKESEENLRNAKEYAELIFKVTPSAIFTVDIDRVVTSWNKKAEDITGYSAEEMVGRKCDIFANEPCNEKCGLYADDVQKPISGKECTIIKKDGTKLFISKNVDLLRDEQGNVIGGIESFVDITVQKRSQDMMRSAYTELDQIFQSAGDGMLVFDKELRIVRANKTLLELVGKTRRELVAEYCGKVFDDFISGVIKDSMERIIDGADHVNSDVTITGVGGVTIPCILTVTSFRNRDGDLVGGIGSFRDITERKSAEKALLDNIRLKSNFTSMVSHELRTPLTAIKEGIGIVLDGSAGDINEEQEDFLATAKRNVDRLGRLINDVLDFTKLQSGKMAMKVSENDITAVIEDIAKIQKPVAEEKGLFMKTEIVPGIPNAQFDQDRVTQVIMNLVNNALKFTEEGGVTISAYPKGQEICVSVDDTGPGIKDSDLPKVFQEFRQIEDAKTRKAGGTGLGLAISREIIQRHGGRIWVESVHGKGSQFKFTLPVVRKYKILVVDDEEVFVNFCTNVLKGEEYEVISAGMGMDGVNIVREERPDLIIMDMVLPDINGYEVIGRLRSEKELAAIPVLAVSGHAEKLKELDKMEVPAESSAMPRLTKPIDPTLFTNTVKELLALSE
jgi:PAS domain S-box-containing protein